MSTILKDVVKGIIRSVVNVSGKTQIGRYLHSQIAGTAMEQMTEVMHNGLKLKFSTPNALCRFRAESLSTKEPETLEWIDAIPDGSILWDIGANVGLYSVYAAKKRNCRVWAFEPSVFNLELLARNIFLNGLTDQICIVPLALSDHLGANKLHMTSKEWGGALSTFGQDFGFDGHKLKETFKFQTVGLSMVDAVEKLGLPKPDYIKMDVDGIEHLILKSGGVVLRDLKGIIVEINDDFTEQADGCRKVLTEAGLTLSQKRHSEMFDNSNTFGHTYNQIWIRS
ncbi:MAG: FkbM family methyltransferase [Gallionella sp.]|nr:FkbM family methyltransferase [Gallionella sp.]